MLMLDETKTMVIAKVSSDTKLSLATHNCRAFYEELTRISIQLRALGGPLLTWPTMPGPSSPLASINFTSTLLKGGPK